MIFMPLAIRPLSIRVGATRQPYTGKPSLGTDPLRGTRRLTGLDRFIGLAFARKVPLGTPKVGGRGAKPGAQNVQTPVTG